jgi:hypothetical protein
VRQIDPELDVLLKYRAQEIRNRRTRVIALSAVAISLVALGLSAAALLLSLLK